MFGGYQTKSEVRVNGPKANVWNPAPTTYHGSSSAQWAPVQRTSGGYGGPPVGSGDQDVIWDEANGGYWIKETIVDSGYTTSTSAGGVSSGYSPISSVPVGHTDVYGFGHNGCRGCASGPVKSSCGCQSGAALVPRRSCGCQAPVMTLPAPQPTVISLPHKSCNCSSSKSTTAYPIIQSMYRSGGYSACGGGSAISCGCHAKPSCGCGSYH